MRSFTKDKRGFPVADPELIDDLSQAGQADEFPFQGKLAREIEQDHGHKKREKTLAGENQHGQSGQYQNQPECIFQKQQTDSEDGTMLQVFQG